MTVGITELIEALRALQREFECDGCSATYRTPDGTVVTLSLAGPDLLTIRDDRGHEYLVPVR